MNRLYRAPIALASALALGLTLGLLAQPHPQLKSAAQALPPNKVTLYGMTPTSSIAGGVIVPTGTSLLFTSGTGATPHDKSASPTAYAYFGDTKTQAESALHAVEAQLKAHGLTLTDVIYMRVYVAPDKTKGGVPDFKGWFAAYGEFFGTKENPTKVARSTISVPALVVPGWLIEIEAVAAYK